MQRNRSHYKISEAPTEGDPVNIYLFKFDNRNTRERCEICLLLTIKTPERCQPHQYRFSFSAFTCSNSTIETLEKSVKYVYC